VIDTDKAGEPSERIKVLAVPLFAVNPSEAVGFAPVEVEIPVTAPVEPFTDTTPVLETVPVVAMDIPVPALNPILVLAVAVAFKSDKLFPTLSHVELACNPVSVSPKLDLKVEVLLISEPLFAISIAPFRDVRQPVQVKVIVPPFESCPPPPKGAVVAMVIEAL